MGKIHKVLLVINKFLTSYGEGRKREEFGKYVKIGNYFNCFLLIENDLLPRTLPVDTLSVSLQAPINKCCHKSHTVYCFT